MLSLLPLIAFAVSGDANLTQETREHCYSTSLSKVQQLADLHGIAQKNRNICLVGWLEEMILRKIDATYKCHAFFCCFHMPLGRKGNEAMVHFFSRRGARKQKECSADILARSLSSPMFLYPSNDRNLTLNLEDSLSETADVLACNASNADTAVLGGVDGVLLSELSHLLGGQAGVGEHADLAGDMAPVVLAAELLEVVLEQGAHLDDAVGHALDFAQPLLVERGVVEDGAGDAGAVDGRVGVERAHEDLDLRVDALGLFGGGGDDGEGADALTVETLGWMSVLFVFFGDIFAPSYHVLGEGLGQAGLVALLNEVAERESVLVGVARGEALVGHVEEGIVVAVLVSIADLLPLLLGRVNTSGVVCASVEQDNAALWHGLDVGNHAIEVKADGVLVVVAVLLDLKTAVREDGLVVGP